MSTGQAHASVAQQRKRSGSFYTPPALVEQVLDWVLDPVLDAACAAPDPAAAVRALRICDPACGNGRFLVAAGRRIAGRLAALGQAGADVSACLHGVDISPAAVAECRQALGPGAALRCADALLLDWPTAFPAAFSPAAGGFDAVLGNPPYLNAIEARTRPGAAEGRLLRRAYASARGAADRSVLFQELGLRLCRPGGYTGFIVPNKVLSAPFGQAFRRYALQHGELRRLCDLSQAGHFRGVAVYPVVCVLQATPEPRPSYPVVIGPGASGGPGQSAPSPREDETWGVLFSPGRALLDRLREGPRLGQLLRVSASATTGDAYRLLPWLREAEDGDFRFVTSGAIDRYACRHGQRPLAYLGRTFARPGLPPTCPVLRPARARHYGSEKLLLSGLGLRLEAIHDPGGRAGAVSTVQVLGEGLSLHLALAALNSRLLSWVFRQHFGALSLRGGYLRIGARQVASLPACPLDPADPAGRRRAERAAELALRAMALGGDAAIEAELDALIYELYGLSDEEVRRVEGEACAEGRIS